MGRLTEQLNSNGRLSQTQVEIPDWVTLKQGVASDIQKRRSSFQEGLASGQSPLSSGFQAVGQGAGLIGDVLLRGLSASVSDVIEKPVVGAIQKGIGRIVETKPAQQVIESVTNWAKQNPEAARNLEAALNIAALAPIGKGAQVGIKGGEKTLSGVGSKLIVSGEEALSANRRAFVQDLVRSAQTKATKEAQVARTTEVGGGITKKSVIAPSFSEDLAGKYVTNIPKVSPKNTLQGNYNVIAEANRAEARTLEASLKTNDFVYPRKELLSRLKNTKAELAKNPVITGDAEKTAEKLIAEIERRINATPSKGSNLLQVRKDFDAWVESQKGGTAFDPVKENAFSVANREIRRTVNTFLDDKAPSVGVKTSLKKQSALYDALDNIKPKAAYEADTALKRFLQRAEGVLGTKNRAVQILAATVGIGGLGAAATFAPGAAVLGTGGYLLYRGGKLVLAPNVRKALGQILIDLDKVGTSKAIGGVVGGGLPTTGIIGLQREIQKILNDY